MARGGGGGLTQLAEAIGEGLRDAETVPPELYALARSMADRGLTAELAAATFAQARAKRPKTARIDGFLFLLGGALEELRLRRNAGSSTAKRELDAVMTLLDEEAGEGAEPGLIMALGRTLALAGLTPSAALQEAMVAGMDAAAPRSAPEMSPEALQASLDDIVQGLGDDPFRIQSELAAMAAALPAEHRAALIRGLASSDSAAVRGAGLGFALDPDDGCALAALTAARDAVERLPLSAIDLSRLVRMRPWLPQTRRAAADQLIAQSRRAAPALQSEARGEVERWLATPTDGAGAQSLFALVKLGRMRALGSVLIKLDEGVCDVWMADGISKREAAELLKGIVEEAGGVEVTGDFFARRIADCLAANAAASPPPFNLVQVLEAVGCGPLPPAPLAPADLCEALLSALPAHRTGAEALALAHAGSSRWGRHVDAVDTWFEADETVDALLGTIRGRKKRVAAVLAQILPTRRGSWSRRLAWTAATLQAKAELDPIRGPLWIDMALVARDIANDAPLADMPLMRQIAEDTVRAFEGGRL